MVTEKMLELLLLYRILNDQPVDTEQIYFNEKPYDINKMIKRYMNLTAEFLEPYVIDSDPKG